jgi:hypothetical protein
MDAGLLGGTRDHGAHTSVIAGYPAACAATTDRG